ncbi:MAG: methyltransferase [Candidatus Berkelbacteria bacterium Athens1014_28]|uniref:Methyltransferase n=1 Tax=Candidatus Berkelbacteria bacterium Athens1014_28 TaxID=2017145 RepID=A0A554LP87_9BACT|nr:MAG: methyltransferase [Candidatus Berkelbacteria bacterium Athens1014_28]
MVNNNDKYKNYSREELIDELETLKKKKYGLVWDKKNSQEILDAFVNWENVPEKFTPKQFPVLKEIKNKEIETDKTKPVNLLIEGDNYHSLAVLNFTHQNKIDVIYIDPPYNTGNNDFRYNDKFIDREDSFRHSKWLSFMEKRLGLAQKLLKNTGVIFISIDDNEQAQLKLLCDEIFDEENFVANLIWRKKRGGGRGNSLIIPQTEYILVYAKNISKLEPFTKKLSEHKFDAFKYEDKCGKYKREGLDHHSPQGAYERKTLQYDLIIDNKAIYCPTGQWLWSKDRVRKELEDVIDEIKGENIYRNLDITKDNKNRWRASKKVRLNIGEEVRQETLLSFIDDPKITTNSSAQEIINFFREAVFNYSKPAELIKYILKPCCSNNSVVLDFMAGSGTMAQAVLELNKEDGGKRKFILCTNDEEINNNGDKIKHKICTDVCYPRIEKVINGYKNSKGEKVAGLGGNLKYFKTDFVGSDSTDKNKRDLVNKSADMICVKEDIFDLLAGKEFDYRIYQKDKKFLGIVFDLDAIADFKKEAEKFKGNFVVYCFSYSEFPPEKEFGKMKNKYVLKPIPAVILKVYSEIFKDKKSKK